MCPILLLINGQQHRARCLPTQTPGHDFRFEFRFARQNTSVTHLAFYDSSVGTITAASQVIDASVSSQCQSGSIDGNGLLSVGFSVNGSAASLHCGISKAGDTYTITAAAIAASGNSAFRFTCTTTGVGGNLNFPDTLAITDFETGNIVDRVAYRGNQANLRFEVLHADGNKIRSTEARLGELLQLRVVYDKDFQDGPDNWGRVFHVSFLPHADAEMSLQVVTPGLGTWVKVTGSFPGKTFTEYYVIKRDQETKIVLPDAYQPTLNINDKRWFTLNVAVRVEVQTPGDVVAIRALSKKRTGQEAGSFRVLPDDVLGQAYNCYGGSDDQNDGLVNVFAISGSTAVTFDFSEYNRGGVRINNNQINPTETITMNENDVLTMQCDKDCHEITLTSNKPVGVVTGHERENLDNGNSGVDHFISQLPPVTTYGTRFVLVPDFLYQIILADPTDKVDYTRQSGTQTNVDSGEFINDVVSAELFMFSKPVLLLAMPKSGSTPPYTMPYPSIYQWATRHYVFVKPGESYALTVVAQTGQTADIELRDTSGATSLGHTTLGDIAGFLTVPVIANSGSAYETYTFIPTNPVTKGPALIELKTGSNEKPFMLLVETILPGHNNVRSLAIGTRFPTVNPCVVSGSNVANSFVTGQENIPGDMVDNDCNGEIDEQLNDGTNDGSDLAPHPVNPNIGVYVHTLVVSNNALFPTDGTAETRALITDGCPSNTLGIQPFTWNRGIGEQFTTYHVMDTQPFRAFSLRTPTLYFRVNIGFCTGNLTGSKCDNSCQSGGRRKRQDSDENVQLETHIEITDAETQEQPGPEETCTMNTLYYIPTVLLLLTIFVEALMNGVFLYIKFSLKQLE